MKSGAVGRSEVKVPPSNHVRFVPKGDITDAAKLKPR